MNTRKFLFLIISLVTGFGGLLLIGFSGLLFPLGGSLVISLVSGMCIGYLWKEDGFRGGIYIGCFWTIAYYAEKLYEHNTISGGLHHTMGAGNSKYVILVLSGIILTGATPYFAKLGMRLQQKFSNSKKYRIGANILIGGGFISSVVCLLGIATVFLGPEIKKYLYSVEFNTEKWRQATMESNTTKSKNQRVWMVDDLIKKHKNLYGLTKDEVVNLLGKPTETGYFADLCDYIYWLGPERGFISIDSEWYCIRFEDNKVNQASVITD